MLWRVVDDPANEDIPGIGRLLALTDGVVAIALTLLVLQFQVPVTHTLERNAHSASALWSALAIDRDALTSYLVSFVVIAQFWLVHHRMLRGMRGHSEGLAWRNFGFLLALTLMPFMSDLLGKYGNNPLAITLFGLNLVALSLTTQWIYRYAERHHLLMEEARSAHNELAGRLRALLNLAIVGLAILLAWLDTGLSRYAWLLFILMPGTAERIAQSVERKRVQPAVQTGA
jgi:uncharacterized membrane protein